MLRVEARSILSINPLDHAHHEIAELPVVIAGDYHTGEMHYGNIFRHIAAKAPGLVIGMEHGNSKPGREGEIALIEAYRQADPGVIK